MAELETGDRAPQSPLSELPPSAILPNVLPLASRHLPAPRGARRLVAPGAGLSTVGGAHGADPDAEGADPKVMTVAGDAPSWGGQETAERPAQVAVPRRIFQVHHRLTVSREVDEDLVLHSLGIRPPAEADSPEALEFPKERGVDLPLPQSPAPQPQLPPAAPMPPAPPALSTVRPDWPTAGRRAATERATTPPLRPELHPADLASAAIPPHPFPSGSLAAADRVPPAPGPLIWPHAAAHGTTPLPPPAQPASPGSIRSTWPAPPAAAGLPKKDDGTEELVPFR